MTGTFYTDTQALAAFWARVSVIEANVDDMVAKGRAHWQR